MKRNVLAALLGLAIVGVSTPGSESLAQTESLVVSQADDLVLGQTVEVQYELTGEAPTIGDEGVTIDLVGIVGFCHPAAKASVFYDTGLGYDPAYCSEIELSEDQLTGSATLPVERFIDSTHDGPLDCLDLDPQVLADYGECFVGYSVHAEIQGAVSDEVLVQHNFVPVSFRQQIRINDGEPTSTADEPVTVRAFGQPTARGAVAFVMLCHLDPARPGLAGLVCAPDIGSVEPSFDGQFDGEIRLPTTLTAGGIDFDCSSGRGCLVVYAAIEADLDVLSARGQWVRATAPQG